MTAEKPQDCPPPPRPGLQMAHWPGRVSRPVRARARGDRQCPGRSGAMTDQLSAATNLRRVHDRRIRKCMLHQTVDQLTCLTVTGCPGDKAGFGQPLVSCPGCPGPSQSESSHQCILPDVIHPQTLEHPRYLLRCHHAFSGVPAGQSFTAGHRFRSAPETIYFHRQKPPETAPYDHGAELAVSRPTYPIC